MENQSATYIRVGNKVQLNESKTKITDVVLEKLKSNNLSLELKDNELEKNKMDETSYSIYLEFLRYIEEETRKLRGEKIKLGKSMKKNKI